MRPSKSRSHEAAALIAALAITTPRLAAAQSCCTGTYVLSPARLVEHEDALIGLQAKVAGTFGSFDATRRFVGAPAGTNEIGVEQDLVGAVRLAPRTQASALLPLIQTWRRVPGRAEAGVGLGDVQLGARYDFTFAGASRVVPGIALSIGAALPTGVAPEAAKKPLATDATGEGAARLSAALSFEQTFKAAFVHLTGSFAWHAPRDLAALEVRRGEELGAIAAAGYQFDGGQVIALSAAYTGELPSTLNGARVKQSGRAATRFGATLAIPLRFTDGYRLQGGVSLDPPIPGLGKNQPTGAGFTLMLVRTFS